MKKKEMIYASPEESFYVNGGPVISNLKDLLKALEEEISDEQYKYHIERGQNDFSVWIRDILGDKGLSSSLSRVRTRKTAIKKVREALKEYE